MYFTMRHQTILSDIAADFGDDLGLHFPLEHFVPTKYGIDIRSEDGMEVVLSLAHKNVSDCPFDEDTGTMGVLRIPHLKTSVEMPKLKYGENVTEGTVRIRMRSDEEEAESNPRGQLARDLASGVGVGEQVTMRLQLPTRHVLRRARERRRGGGGISRREPPFLSVGALVVNWEYSLNWWPSVPKTVYRKNRAQGRGSGGGGGGSGGGGGVAESRLPSVPGCAPATGGLPVPRLVDIHSINIDCTKNRVMASAAGAWAMARFFENYLDAENC
jgi:hypothetical protein